MRPPRIEGLSAALVPPWQFASRKWFYATPLWYYHRPGTTPRLNTNGRFYELVDPELRPLCHMLHRAGIRTTPSCQGHFYPKERFEWAWEQLRREEELIRTAGLIVRDSETDRPYLFADDSYGLGWSTSAAFYDAVASHQSHGHIGLVLPPWAAELAEALRRDGYESSHAHLKCEPAFSSRLMRPMFSATVQAADPDGRRTAWRHLHGYLQSILQSHGATATVR